MTEKIDLKKIERKAYTSYHQDGLIDIFAAFFILSFGLLIVLDMVWMGWIFFVVGTSIYAAAKRVFTIPRIGFVKFRQQRTQLAVGILVGLGLLSSVLGLVTFMQVEGGSTPLWLLLAIEYYMPFIGLLVAAAFSLVGYTFRTKRMYAYALLALGLFIPGHFLSYPLHYYVILLGALILLFGSAMLLRFIRRYPASAGDATGGSGNEEK